jgi:hypothetical protein
MIVFTLTMSLSYAQDAVVTAEDDLFKKALDQIKAVAVNRGLREVAVWKIEVDDGKSVNVRELSDRLNVALIDEGLLADQAIDLSGIEDRGELRRIASVYRITALIYGRRTAVEGGAIRVSFQLLDVATDALIWEGMVTGGEEGLPLMLYGKWTSLGTGVATGLGATTTIVLTFDAYNRYLKARGPDTDRAYNEVITYLGWSVGLGLASMLSGGVAAYLFLTDQEGASSRDRTSLLDGGRGVGGEARDSLFHQLNNPLTPTFSPCKGEMIKVRECFDSAFAPSGESLGEARISGGILIWPKPGGVMAGVYLRF